MQSSGVLKFRSGDADTMLPLIIVSTSQPDGRIPQTEFVVIVELGRFGVF